MGNKTITNLGLVRRASIFVFTSALFALAYAQSPLYTSNQNQYFLHGLAKAGLGILREDWLANTADPTPVFSALVYFTASLFKQEFLFYFYYALLMGVYLFSLIGIANAISKISIISKRRQLTFILVALLICIHSAAIRFLLSRILGVNWAYVLEDGVADQRILGPVFQPSTFGVFLIASIILFIKNKPYLAILAAVFAATVHPTYLLSAGTLTMIYILATAYFDKNPSQAILLSLTALITIAPVLIYAYSNFIGASQQDASAAREILVNYRIPHHAIPNQWFDATAITKILITFTALYLVRGSRKLFIILLGSTVVASLLTIIQVATGSYFLALLFPWRISIFIIPLSTTIILAKLLVRIFSIRFTDSNAWSNRIIFLGWVFALMAIAIGIIRFSIDVKRQGSAPERKIEAYVYTHKFPDDVYLIPIKMQDFRLSTGAPAYIDFKSIPYKNQDVLEWYRRVRLADELYNNQDCSLLENITEDRISHLVVETGSFLNLCPNLVRLYEDEDYSLYRIENSPSGSARYDKSSVPD